MTKATIALAACVLMAGCASNNPYHLSGGDRTAGSMIVDNTDDFRDKRRLAVVVMSSKPKEDGAMYFHCRPKSQYARVGISFSPAGSLFHVGDTADTKLRFDDDPYETLTMLHVDGAVLHVKGLGYLDQSIANDLLRVKVENSETMSFDLVAARDDLKEFNRMCREWAAQ